MNENIPWQEWHTDFWWPDWTSVDECKCGTPMRDIPDGEDHCPKCGLELRELVYPHCDMCGDMIVGQVFTNLDDGLDYCPACYQEFND